MTCETVREHLLEADLEHLEHLSEHLQGCPGCAALADAAVDAQRALRQQLEDFVTTQTLDAQWADALRQVPPRRRLPLGLHGALLGLAAAAVLAVTVWPQGGPGPEQPPPSVTAATAPAALLEIRDRIAAFEDIETHDLPTEGLSRKAEDALMQQTLTEKVSALTALEASLVAIASDDQQAPRWQIQALHDLAGVYHAMGDALDTFDHPSYLSEEQSEIYSNALEAKAKVQWQKASETYRLAVDRARSEGLEPEAIASERALELLLARLIAIEEAERRAEAALTASAVEDRPRVERLHESLRASLDRCGALDARSREEVEMILEQSGAALAEDDLSLYSDLRQLLEAHVPKVTEACGPLPSR